MLTLMNKIKKWITHPSLILSFVDNKTGKLFSRKYRWSESRLDMTSKEYRTYEEYIEHQKSKLKKVQYHILSTYDDKYRLELRKRLIDQGLVKKGMNVLCLAARLGTEVKSFLDLGCFAIGLDLNPGKENKYVVCGDFHNIQFPDQSVDVVFSNSLDHTFDLPRLIKEIKRILKIKGLLVLEIGRGTEEGSQPGYYEALAWKKIDDLTNEFIKSGFIIVKRSDFEYPWKGQHVSFELNG